MAENVIHLLLSPYRVFKLICFWAGFAVISSVVALMVFLIHFYHYLPNLQTVDFIQLKGITERVVYKRLEDKKNWKKYHWTDMKDISRDYLYSIVMSEDAGFFEHDGIEYHAIMDAIVENVKRGRYQYGASTISQQVVKNLFLTNEKSIIRKLKELILTQRLEHRFSKNQILEIYLNIAEFGPDAYGVAEAAELYFGKSPAKINAAEGAFIALMLPSPRKNYYSIYQNKNIAPTKRHKMRRVLGDMLANEYISQNQYRDYIKYKFFSNMGQRGLAQTTHH